MQTWRQNSPKRRYYVTGTICLSSIRHKTQNFSYRQGYDYQIFQVIFPLLYLANKAAGINTRLEERFGLVVGV